MPTYTPISPVALTPLSEPPNTGDILDFDTRADTHVQEVYDMVPEINAANVVNYNNAQSAFESAQSTAADVLTVESTKDLAIDAKNAAVVAQGLSEAAKDASTLSAADAAASALAAATGGGLPVSPGAIGSVVTWDGTRWVSVLPSAPSIVTGAGDVVPSGNLLAIDDAGLPMSVDTVSPITVATGATIRNYDIMLHSNGNIFVVYTLGTTVYLVVLTKKSAVVLSATSVGTCVTASYVKLNELSNGDILLGYKNGSSVRVVKVLNTSGVQVVAEKDITIDHDYYSVAIISGNFIVYAGNGKYIYRTIYSNGLVTGATNFLALLPDDTMLSNVISSIVQSDGTTFHFCEWYYNASPATMYTICTRINSGFTSVLASGYANSGDSGTSQSSTLANSYFVQLRRKTSSPYLLNAFIVPISTCVYETPITSSGINYGINSINRSNRVLGQLTPFTDPTATCYVGGKLVTFTFSSNQFSESEYYVYDEFGSWFDNGRFIKYGNGNTLKYPDWSPKVIGVGVSGIRVLYLDSLGNLKMVVINSGKIIGISQGQDGLNTVYKTTGYANDLSGYDMLNILNVGDLKRQGKKVFI